MDLEQLIPWLWYYSRFVCNSWIQTWIQIRLMSNFWATVFLIIFGTLQAFPSRKKNIRIWDFLNFCSYLIAATEYNAITMNNIKRVQFAPLDAKFCEKTVGTDHFRFSKFDSNLAGAWKKEEKMDLSIKKDVNSM